MGIISINTPPRKRGVNDYRIFDRSIPRWKGGKKTVDKKRLALWESSGIPCLEVEHAIHGGCPMI